MSRRKAADRLASVLQQYTELKVVGLGDGEDPLPAVSRAGSVASSARSSTLLQRRR